MVGMLELFMHHRKDAQIICEELMPTKDVIQYVMPPVPMSVEGMHVSWKSIPWGTSGALPRMIIFGGRFKKCFDPFRFELNSETGALSHLML